MSVKYRFNIINHTIQPYLLDLDLHKPYSDQIQYFHNNLLTVLSTREFVSLDGKEKPETLGLE